MNKGQRDRSTYRIEADGLDGLVYEGKREVKALAGEVLSLPVEPSIEPEKTAFERQRNQLPKRRMTQHQNRRRQPLYRPSVR